MAAESRERKSCPVNYFAGSLAATVQRPRRSASPHTACVCSQTAPPTDERQDVSELAGVERGGAGEASVKRSEQVDGAGPQALVLDRDLFSD
jgi:hypothetical protein